MATSRRSRTIPAPVQRVWEVVADPHHMPRWWPGVQRMEGVGDERFTQVHMTKKGRAVRLDFLLTESEPPHRRAWTQELAGTPFERVLSESITEVVLEPEDGATRVTIAQHHRLRGSKRTGGFLLRRATNARLDEALDGLERVCA